MANAYYDGMNDAGPSSDNGSTIDGFQAMADMRNHPMDGPRQGNMYSGAYGYGTNIGRGDTVNDMINGDLTRHPMDGRGGMGMDCDGDY